MGVWRHGERKVRRGGWGDPGGMGWWGWRKGGFGSREVEILIKGAILGLARGVPRCTWAAEERVPKLALFHNHTDEYLAYHHRTFIWRWMEIETETHIGALD